MKVFDLVCNHLSEPLGVETTCPRLSWKLESEVRGVRQTAYEIQAATSVDRLTNDIADLWGTGKVPSDQSLHVPYAGKTLGSRQVVFWQVRVWDQADQPSAWSSVAHFEMGLLAADDWQAPWIGSPEGRTEIDHAVPAPHFRKEVTVDDSVVQARVYVSGLGFYELRVNGHKVGDAVLSPAFTRYDQTVLYQTFDITPFLRGGTNVFGIILGNGWYNGFTDDVWDFRQAPWRAQRKFCLQAHLAFANGDERVILSGSDWKTAPGPILFDGLRNGETYDARRELPGWDVFGYDDSTWQAAKIVRSPGGIMASEQMPPIRALQTLTAVAVHEIGPKTFVFDMGQNISGWARIRVRGAEGTVVTLRYSEDLDKDGHLDTSHIDCFIKSGDFQTDRYVLKGDGEEVWEPRFVYHGFRYVEVSGLEETSSAHTLSGRVVHTDLASRGHFACSNPLLNQIQSAARWSTLTNYHGFPTDCPHREKNGWTGDAALSAEQVLMNFDPVAAYQKWIRDLKDVQRPSGQIPGIAPTGGWGYNWGSGPAWDSALFLIPWYVYQYTGDDALLASTYASMQSYLHFALSMADGGIFDFGLGDWCPPTGGPGAHACPAAVTDTAYVYIMATVLQQAAKILGRDEDEVAYASLAVKIRAAFRRNFLDLETMTVMGNCQTATACALYQGLAEESERPQLVERLIAQIEAKGRHLDTGILGAKYVMHALADAGRSDIAYAIASQTSFPSWGHWLAQGATTLWEQWDGEGSHNHHMFSDISAWFYQGLAGILPDREEPGFRHIVFRPQVVDDLDFVEASHDSLYGRIACRWETSAAGLTVRVSVPANCHATLHVPQGYAQNLREGQGDLDPEMVDRQGDHLVVALGSGDYAFIVERGPLKSS